MCDALQAAVEGDTKGDHGPHFLDELVLEMLLQNRGQFKTLLYGGSAKSHFFEREFCAIPKRSDLLAGVPEWYRVGSEEEQIFP
jgi:hypothetical protein